MRVDTQSLKRGSLIFSWALYDLANQFFALNVVSLYFVRWLTFEKGAPEIFYSISFGISTIFIAILSPIFGSISDLTERRRIFLAYLTFLSVIFTIAIGLSSNILLALIFFAIANFGCQTAIVFYNALMVNIAPKNKIGFVSGFGKMLGYSGAIIALYLIKPIQLAGGYQATFLPTGIMFLLFALPCLLFVKDKKPRSDIKLMHLFNRDKAIEIFRQLKISILNAHKIPGLINLLFAMFFGLCAVYVIILFMSVYATKIYGLSDSEVVNLIGFSTIFAIIGSITSGFISDYVGYKRTLCSIFVLWTVCFLLGALNQDSRLYWLIGALAGLAMSSGWVVSRAALVRLVPEEKIGEMFGLFNIVNLSSSIVGSAFYGITIFFLSALGSLGYRISLASLIIFSLSGLRFLLLVPKLNTAKNHGTR